MSDEPNPQELAQESACEVREVVVPPQFHGQRLDRMLAWAVPEFSRSYLQQLVEQGAVVHKGLTAHKAATKVKAGEPWVVELRATPQSQAFKPEVMALAVVFEDQHLRIIYKPAGLVVHPAPGHWSGTLLNGLLALDAQALELPRAGIVHRLDKDTSGLMVVARTRAAMDSLVKLIAAHDVRRRYLAVCAAPWRGARQQQVDVPIGRDPSNRLRMAVVDLAKHPGKTAQTTIERLADSSEGCLLRCTLHTGRTHQIRVHMAHLGMPLVGDAIYGGPVHPCMPRQALHAYHLAFAHPVSGAPLEFFANPPPDFLDLLQAWGLSYNQST